MTTPQTRKPHAAAHRRAAMLAIAFAASAGTFVPAVASDETPSVRLVSPAQGGSLTPGTRITPDVSDGIFRVVYTLSTPGGYTTTTYLLGASDTPPFAFTYRGIPSGLVASADVVNWRLVATAFDSSGRVVRSDAAVAGIQVVPAVTVPGTWVTVPQRGFAPSPSVADGAVNAGILISGQLSALITTFPVEGAKATYSLSVPAAGTYDLHVAQGRIGRSERFLRIEVNGVVVSDAARFAGSVTQQPADVRRVVSVRRVPLSAGANTVVLTAVDGAGPDIFNVYTAASR
jgi:hypothetical protein